MSIVVNYRYGATVIETLETNVPAAPSPQIVHSGFVQAGTLRATTTPPVTKAACFQQALSGGAGTIDLRTLTGTNGLTLDGNGLKVQIFEFINTATNGVTISAGASNPYNLFGASFSLALAAGESIRYLGHDTSPDIGSSSKTIDLAGTGTDSFSVEIVMG